MLQGWWGEKEINRKDPKGAKKYGRKVGCDSHSREGGNPVFAPRLPATFKTFTGVPRSWDRPWGKRSKEPWGCLGALRVLAVCLFPQLGGWFVREIQTAL